MPFYWGILPLRGGLGRGYIAQPILMAGPDPPSLVLGMGVVVWHRRLTTSNLRFAGQVCNQVLWRERLTTSNLRFAGQARNEVLWRGGRMME